VCFAARVQRGGGHARVKLYIGDFHHYLHQNICQGCRRRDPGIDTEPAKTVLEGHKQIDKCVIAGAHVFDRLWEWDLNVTNIC
jgi:hypothetical protein